MQYLHEWISSSAIYQKEVKQSEVVLYVVHNNISLQNYFISVLQPHKWHVIQYTNKSDKYVNKNSHSW